MLNQALNEIQAALDTLNETVHCEPTETELSENLEMIKANVTKTIDILQKVELSLASDKVKVVSTATEPIKSQGNYYQDNWQKTA